MTQRKISNVVFIVLKQKRSNGTITLSAQQCCNYVIKKKTEDRKTF